MEYLSVVEPSCHRWWAQFNTVKIEEKRKRDGRTGVDDWDLFTRSRSIRKDRLWATDGGGGGGGNARALAQLPSLRETLFSLSLCVSAYCMYIIIIKGKKKKKKKKKPRGGGRRRRRRTESTREEEEEEEE